MSFVSSAFPSKQIAPKAPARRRPVTAAKSVPIASSGSLQAPPSDATNEAETRAQDEVSRSSAPAPSSLEQVADNIIPVPIPTTSIVAQPISPFTVLNSDGAEILKHAAHNQSSETPAADVVNDLVQAAADTRSPPPRKRAREALNTSSSVEAGQNLPAKRQKRSSTRSNALVQAQVNEDSVSSPSIPSLSVNSATTVPVPPASRRRSASSATADVDTTLRFPASDEVTGLRSAGDTTVGRPRATRRARGTTRSKSARAERQVGSSARPKLKGKKKLGEAVIPPEDRQREQPAFQDEDPTASRSSPRPARRLRKRRMTLGVPADDSGELKSTSAVRAKRKRNRSDSDDPELHEIDTNTLSMYDLSLDDKRGRTSAREKEMAKIDWNEVSQKRRHDIRREAERQLQQQRDKTKAKDHSNVNTRAETAEGDNEENQRARSSQPPEDEEAAVRPLASQGPVLRIVNGEIVADEASLAVQTAPTPDVATNADVPVEEENDLTQRINRLNYLNARKRDPAERVPVQRGPKDRWTDEETDRFFDLLWAFGTDFGTIARYFAPRSRKQVKTKFTREERLDPDRVTDMLLHRGPKPLSLPSTGSITLEQYAADTNSDLAFYTKYESAEHADEVIRKSMAGRQEEALAAIAEEEEERRQRQIQKEMDEHGKKEKAKQREQKRREKSKYGGRKSKNLGVGTLGGVAAAEE